MKSILIVEDNSLVRELITSCLSKLQAKLRAVNSAEEANASLRRDGLPDLILCDVILPQRTGKDFIQHLRAHAQTAQLPVIAVTTLADGNEAQRLKQAGFSDVIPKPIDPVNFAAQVSRWLK